MTGPADDSRCTEGLDSLCEVVVQTLKELTAARQPISPAVLRQTLSQKQEVMGLLRSSSRGDGAVNDSVNDGKARIQTLEIQKSRLSAQLDQMEERNARIKEFNKRSLVSFIALLRAHDNKALAKALHVFKQRLLDDAEPEVLEKSLYDIKNILLKEEADVSKTGRNESTIWGKLTRRKEPDQPPAPSADLNFSKLKEAYLDVFAEFHSDLGREYLDSFARTQQSIRGSENIDHLLSHTDEIIHLIQTYIRLINEERTRVISFFSELESNLAEMEGHFIASIDRTSQAQQADMSFNQTLEGQLEDINDSARFSKSLEEFKGLVFTKLTTIKSALNKKREEDDTRRAEIAREVEGLQKNLQTLKDEVTLAQEKAKVLEWETLMDPLTGIHNRRAYERRIVSELDRYRRYQHTFSMLLFDLDDFKKVNDQYGHHAGDRCLKEIIKRIKPALRDLDFLTRYGGEEFIVILPGTDREAAFNVAERLRHLVEKTKFLYQGKVIPITISVGVTEVNASDEKIETLFTRVDKAVYEAKRAGRNRVVAS